MLVLDKSNIIITTSYVYGYKQQNAFHSETVKGGIAGISTMVPHRLSSSS